MQITVEKTRGLERRMTVTLPAERVDNEIESRLKQLSRRAKIKGFRPGKVPFKVVQQQYGPQVRQDVMSDLLRESYSEALNQEKLNPAGGPSIEPVKMEPGKGLEYTATFEVYPDITLKNLEDLKVERPRAEITPADVDKMIENLRRQHAEWETVARAAAAGDRITIDFAGDIKGEAFEGNTGERFPVVLGEGRMVEGFEAALTGLAAGEEKDFDIKFPKDYPAPAVAGKKAHFHVKAHEVAARKLPELDEAFLKTFGIKEGGVEALRRDVQANMQRELDAALRRRVKDRVLDALLAANKVELPKALVSEEIERMRQDALRRFGGPQQKNVPQLPDELFAEQAQRRVSLGLLIGEVLRSEKLTPEPERVNKALAEAVEGYEKPEEALRSFRSNPSIMRQVEGMVLEEQAVDRLLEKAQVTDKPTSFDELMNNAQ